MLTTDGMWRPNGIAQARRFATFDRQMEKLRLKGKWYAFQCRRRGDAQGLAHWSQVVALHEADMAQMRAEQVRP